MKINILEFKLTLSVGGSKLKASNQQSLTELAL